MSFRSSFSIRKSNPRKFISRSPLQLPAEELARELGPRYQTIDARIGNQIMIYDATQGYWMSSGTVATTVSSREMTKLEKTKRELEEDNHTLRAKLGSLLQMLAEVTAEHQLRQTA